MSDGGQDLIPLYCEQSIGTAASILNEFLTKAYVGASRNAEQFSFRIVDSDDGALLATPSKPPIKNFRHIDWDDLISRGPELPLLWRARHLLEFPAQPRLVRNVCIELDDLTKQDGKSCRLKGPSGADVRVEFGVALSASLMVHESEDARGAIQILRNEIAVLSAGPLPSMPGTKSFQPLSDEIRRLQQRRKDPRQKEAFDYDGPRGLLLPIFLTGGISLMSLGDSEYGGEGIKPAIVSTVSIEDLRSISPDKPLESIPESPFLGVSAKEINEFVLSNFPGHTVHWNSFIILDDVTAADCSTCLLVVNRGTRRPQFLVTNPVVSRPSFLGLLRDQWPSVLTTIVNIDIANLDYEDFARAAVGKGGSLIGD
ncbi:MAG: hypothetical protein Q9165_006197 [Trypethelium subeluteriae]